MNDRDWLRYLDIQLVHTGFKGRNDAAVCEDRVRHMSEDDFAALMAQIDDASIMHWLQRTREERDLVIV